jgi:MFS family permease
MAGFVIFTLISLYYDAEQGKAKASAVRLSQRMADVVRFNLDFKDIGGLDTTFKEYRRLNSEISEAALLIGKQVQIGTNPARIGKGWVSESHNFEYIVDIGDAKQTRNVTSLAVTVPRDVVFERVARSIKNFAALFIAAALMSGLFLQVASALQGSRASGAAPANGAKPDLKSDTALVIVKPIFFLAIFLDSMTYSFLPKFMQEAAVASGVSVGFASLPFTAYYLCFALSLIPAGTYADRRGPRPLIIAGLILASLSVLGFALPLGIWGMTGLRGLSGIGQGMLFIGVQSYILAVTPPEKKTQGAAVIVLGFQGGMIAGMAIGSLMVNFLQTRGVFVLSAVTLYTLWLMPTLVPESPQKSTVRAAVSKLGHDLKNVIGSGEFLNAIFCIGIPAKAILTGTITFALPLLLGQLHYRQEDIGQIIMLYGLGVIAATGYVARLVDRKGNTDAILFWGAAMSGIGLVMVGLMGTSVLGSVNITIGIVVIGVVIVGIAHGFINAPVITHMAHSDIADRIGQNPVTTTYRFLERLGHVAGPFLVSQAFLFWGQTPGIVTGIGLAAAILGILFLARKFIPTKPFTRSEAMR